MGVTLSRENKEHHHDEFDWIALRNRKIDRNTDTEQPPRQRTVEIRISNNVSKDMEHSYYGITERAIWRCLTKNEIIAEMREEMSNYKIDTNLSKLRLIREWIKYGNPLYNTLWIDNVSSIWKLQGWREVCWYRNVLRGFEYGNRKDLELLDNMVQIDLFCAFKYFIGYWIDCLCGKQPDWNNFIILENKSCKFSFTQILPSLCVAKTQRISENGYGSIEPLPCEKCTADQDHRELTLLHCAVINCGDPKVIGVLITEYWLDINAVDIDGYSSLCYAMDQDQRDWVERLSAYYPQIGLVTKDV